jgi:hypothetical protein
MTPVAPAVRGSFAADTAANRCGQGRRQRPRDEGPHAKQLLYIAIYNALTPGGAFFNLDGTPVKEELRAIYRAAGGRPSHNRPDDERARLSDHYFETLDEQLDFLRAAGFRLVDCFWKRLDLVLIGGYK